MRRFIALALVASVVAAAPDRQRRDTPAEEQKGEEKEEGDEKFYGLNNGFGGGGFGGPGFGGQFYQPLGYQPGSGYGGADVQFANIGPLGRPALSYNAPGISINLREKQPATRRRRDDTEVKSEETDANKEEGEEKYFGNSFGAGYGGVGGFGGPGYGGQFYQPLGYQPGSGYGGADVQFANIGPLGRPALSYNAPGFSVNLREKQPATRRRRDDKEVKTETAEAKPEEADEKFFGQPYGTGLGGFGGPGYGGQFYQPLGYQPGSGYGGADVQFANIGPLGRPALSYNAPGISINLREKQPAA